MANEWRVSFHDFPVKPESVYFVSCPKRGLEMQAVVLHMHRVGRHPYTQTCVKYPPPGGVHALQW